MPRNSGGTYTLPSGNPVATGTTIQSTWANTTLSDVATEVTNSLDRNGRGSMLAPLKSFDGTIAAPGLVFGNEPTTGFARPSASNMTVSIAGLEVGRWTSAGYAGAMAVTTLTVSGTAAFNGGATIGDALGDALTVNSNTMSVPNGINITGGSVNVAGSLSANSTFSVSGAAAFNGGTTIGNASGDAFTINSNIALISNGLTFTGGDVAFNGSVAVGDASGDAFTINSNIATIPNGLTFTGGNVAFNGSVTVGDASGDAFTVNSNTVTIPNGWAFGAGNVSLNDGRLQVNTNAAAGAVVRIDYDSVNAVRRIHALETGGGNARPLRVVAQTLTYADDSATRFFVDSNGFGVLNTAPSSAPISTLVVGNGSGSRGISILPGTGGEGSLHFTDVATEKGAIKWAASTGSLRFNTSATRRLEIFSDGRVAGTGLHNNGTVTGTSDQFIASGTYTPTLTHVLNITSSTARACQWMRVGNVVTVSGEFDVTATTSGNKQIAISLPIASAFTVESHLGGVGHEDNTSGQFGGPIRADAINDRAVYKTASSLSGANVTTSFTFSYVIL